MCDVKGSFGGCGSCHEKIAYLSFKAQSTAGFSSVVFFFDCLFVCIDLLAQKYMSYEKKHNGESKIS